MRYSIGDVSRVLGMTTSALHFYEKEGIIDTPKVESGWRYYQEADVCRLLSAKKYRAMGVPVRDIAQQFSAQGLTGEQVVARMEEKRAEAAEAARRYAALAQDIDGLIGRSTQALLHPDAVDIRYAEEMMYLRSSTGGRIPLDKGEQMTVKRWLDAMPAVSLSICREMEDKQAVPSLIVSAERAAQQGLSADDNMARLIRGGMALHAVVSCGEEQYEDPDVIFAPLLAFAREHRFVQNGTMWGSMLFVDCSGGRRLHYFDTYMPFC
ncbi:MAG: MerR family transcriptional regulator [Christensenellales bacterium]|nr:MerR family transcriptional regulator [Christensenellales bacterium]